MKRQLFLLLVFFNCMNSSQFCQAQKITASLLSSDTAEVIRLLKKGADINAVDSFRQAD